MDTKTNAATLNRDETKFATQHTAEGNAIETDAGRIVLIPEPTHELLNDKQRVDYRNHRKRWVK